MNIVGGLIGIAISYLILKYRRNIYDFTGPWGSVEKWLGGSGTILAIIVLSLVIFFASIAYMTGNLTLGTNIPTNIETK